MQVACDAREPGSEGTLVLEVAAEAFDMDPRLGEDILRELLGLGPGRSPGKRAGRRAGRASDR